jgi:peptidoglycan hydrolase CwlO-like protein
MEAFFKSEAFRKILSTAVNVAVETAIKCFKTEFVELIDSRINVLEDMNKRLQEDLNKLNRRLNEVQNKANDNEQYSRRNNLRIYGIAEKQIENCYDEVTKFCNEELGVSIERNEIDRAHRVGKLQIQILALSLLS